MRRLFSLLLLPLFLLTACDADAPTRQSREYYDCFDTKSILTLCTTSEEEFDAFFALATGELSRLHRLFDVYHNYEGFANLKTINDNAGIEAVVVEEDILALLRLYQDAYKATEGAVNVALGPVLSLWHNTRETGVLPSPESIDEALARSEFTKLLIDETAASVYLTEEGMSLDVGAIAKGYAAGKAAELAVREGYDHFIMDVGGNIVAHGVPTDRNGADFRVGIQNPFDAGDGYYDLLNLRDGAIVTSGTYQRYIDIDGQRYHHIIDPATGYPAKGPASVSVLHTDAALADFLSTALFLLPANKGRALLEQYGGAALWIYEDGSQETAGDWEQRRIH